MLKTAIICTYLAMTSGTALAARPVDNYVATLIEGSDYGAAEAALSARLVRAHDDQRSLLNLAMLYQSTDRRHEAEDLYARVLARPDIQVATNTGQVMSSHEIARAAVNQASVTVASR